MISTSEVSKNICIIENLIKFYVNAILSILEYETINFNFLLFIISCEDAKEEICIDESNINPDAACPEVFDSVLGFDEQIYSNSCKAEKNGVRFWTEIE